MKKKTHKEKSHKKRSSTPLSPPSPPSHGPLTVPLSSNLRSAILIISGTLLFFLPWLRLPSIAYTPTMQFFCFVLTVGLIALLSGYLFWKRGISRPSSPFFVIVMIWLLIRVIASIFSLAPFHSLWGSYGEWADGLVYFTSILGLLFLLLSLKPEEREINLGLHLLLIQSVLLSAQVVIAAIQEGFPRLIVRPPGPLSNSDYFLSYALLFLPLAVAFFLLSWRRKEPVRRRLLYGLSSLVIFSALFLSLPGEIQGRLIPIPQAGQTKKVSELPQSSDVLGSYSNQERFLEWQLGLRLASQRPWLGIGPGAVETGFYSLQKEVIPGWDYNVVMHHPHNDLIEQYATTGLPGLLAYLSIWIALGALIFKTWKQQSVEKKIIISGLAVGCLLFFLFNQFIFTTVLAGIYLAVFFACLLLLTGSLQFVSISPSSKALRSAVLIGSLGIVFLSYWTIRFTRAEQLVTQGLRASSANQTLLAAEKSSRAALKFPYLSFYSWAAGRHNLLLFLDKKATLSGEDRLSAAQQAVYFARESTKRNPHIPLYQVDQGITEYLVTEPGTTDEQAAIKTMHQGLSLSPHFYQLTLRIADAYADKAHYETAVPLYRQAYPHSPKETQLEIDEKLKRIQTRSGKEYKI